MSLHTVIHIFLTFRCLFYHEHVFSLNLIFELFLGCPRQPKLHWSRIYLFEARAQTADIAYFKFVKQKKIHDPNH